MKSGKNAVRPSPISGLWYSDNAETLKREILSYIKPSEEKVTGDVIGLVAPHAGYRYSGKTAGQAFYPVFGRNYDLVLILSPYHAYHPSEVLSTKHKAYETPLGEISVDHDTLKILREDFKHNLDIELVQLLNDEEHSLEIELPFLQCSLKNAFKILPLMVRLVPPDKARKMAEIIYNRIKGKNVLVVASTDLSHFHPHEVAQELDWNMLAAFEQMTAENIYYTERQKRGFACGAGAVMTAVEICKRMGADRLQVLSYTTSADATGDYDSVVGYGSAVMINISKLGV